MGGTVFAEQRPGRSARLGLAVSVLALVLGLAANPGRAATASVVAGPRVQQVSTDTLAPYVTNGSSMQHATELETDTFAWGSTVVSAFQVGRNSRGYGSQAIGWATSTDNGVTWTHGILPHLTASSPSPNRTYPVVVNQSVAYDARHGRWLIPSVVYLPSGTGAFHEKALLVNRSSDGKSWGTSATTAVSTNVDKAWGVCDNTSSSPHFGTCYVAYSQIDSSDALAVVHTTNGGLSWSAPVQVHATGGTLATGYNTNPVVQPSGNVVLVATDVRNGVDGSALMSTVSKDGGATWSPPASLATIRYHNPPGGIRARNKPSVDVDHGGKVYAAWSDCRFHAGCAADDVVYATSTNGTTWSAPTRVAVDATSTAEDKFIPGFAVEPGTSGASTHLSAVYYTYQAHSCASTCLVQAKYVTSYNAGRTWSAPFAVKSTGFPVSWLPGAYVGGPAMVGDYLSVSFCHGSAVAVVSLATAAPGAGRAYHESEWALTLPVGWGAAAKRSSSLTVGASTRIGYGHAITLRSTLTDTARHLPLVGAVVTLQERRGAAGPFHRLTAVRTDRSGHVSVRVAPHVNYGYRWTWPGGSSYAGRTTAQQVVLVAQYVAAKATAHRVAKRHRIWVYGTVSPRALGAWVTLQVKTRTGWHTVRSARIQYQRMPNGVKRTGYVVSYSSSTAGIKALRVRRAATRTNVVGYSSVIRVLVG